MRVHRRLRHGIFLITTLILVTFLVMLATAIFVSTQIGFAMSGSLANRELAKQAALNGMNFIQAQLETNCVRMAPSPDGVAAAVTINSPDGTMTVVEQGWNIVGWMSNTNVTGPGEQPLYLMFSACFTNSYSACSATTTLPLINGIQLPTSNYVSINNLIRPQAATEVASSYKAGLVYQTVPGETADILVTGYVVSPDGHVLSSRLAEGMFSIEQVGQYVPAGAVAKSDVDLQVISSTGQITVGLLGNAPSTFNGLATFSGNINTSGQVPAGAGTAPALYDSSTKVSLNGSGQFTYQGPSPAPQTTFPQDTQMGAPAPPTIAPGSLPTLSNPVNVQAGTWVVWGTPAALYHYPLDYSSVGMSSGTPVPVQSLPWTQSSPSSAPALNGVAPDQGPLTSLDSGHQITLTPSPSGNTAGNTVTITGNDVNITPVTVAGAPVSSFTLLVAPSETSVGLPIAGSAAVNGSAQVVFQPGSTQSSLQLRDAGTVTIMGNVSGAGSIQSTGPSSDVNVIGKNTLDPRADSGVALYATGNVNVWGTIDASGNTLAQLPSSVAAYIPMLQADPQNVTGTTQITMTQGAAQDLLTRFEAALGANPNPAPGVVSNPVSSSNAGVSFAGGTYTVNIDTSGPVTSGSSQFLAAYNDITNNPTTSPWVTQYSQALPVWQAAFAQYNAGNKAAAQTTFGQGLLQMGFTTADGVNYTISQAAANSETSTGGPLTPPTSPSASPSGGPIPSFDQSFNGLVYASNNFQANTNGAFTVDGGLISNSGTVTVDSSNITINYSAASVGSFAGLFGDRILLHRNTVTVY